MEEIFKASVQYGDQKGSAAADDAAMEDATKWLRKNNHISDDEYVVGISMFAGENHGTHRDPVHVTFLVSSLNGHDNLPEMIRASGEPISVRKIRHQMNVVDFLALFKRLSITLSYGGSIEGKTYIAD